MPSKPIIEFADLPTKVLVDIEGVRRLNPQRFEMEQVSAITLIDTDKQQIVGYKDATENDFWTRGHMPGFPLMPGVLMVEGAAQLGAYYCTHINAFPGADFVGLGGVDNVRFRGAVRPGDRLWMVGQVTKHSSRMSAFDFQGYVDGKMVFEATLLGIAMKRLAE